MCCQLTDTLIFKLVTHNQRKSYHAAILNCIYFVDLSTITLPPAIRKRGRPKGSEKTVIGLPRKKPNKGKGKYNTLLGTRRFRRQNFWQNG